MVDELVRMEVIDDVPERPTGYLVLPLNATLRDAVGALEREYGLVLCGRQLFAVDDVDFRPQFVCEIRLVRYSASVSTDGLDGSAVLAYAAHTAPVGVEFVISETAERSFFDDSIPADGQGNVVARARRTVQAGITAKLRVKPLPNVAARLQGSIDVSSFVGARGVDRAVSTVQVDHDVFREEWITIRTITQSQLSAAWDWADINANAGGSHVAVQIRVR